MKLTKTDIRCVKILASYGFITMFVMGISFGIALESYFCTKDFFSIGMALFSTIVLTPLLLFNFYKTIKNCIKKAADDV